MFGHALSLRTTPQQRPKKFWDLQPPFVFLTSFMVAVLTWSGGSNLWKYRRIHQMPPEFLFVTFL